ITGGVNTTITGNWEQKVTNGDISISTPGTITIKGGTKVDIQSPDWYEFKAAAVALKLFEISSGATEVASRGLKYETNPIQFKFRGNSGAHFEINGFEIKRDIVSIKTAALKIIT
ncbi:type VI secretion system tip protein VgrG, partial [Cronobacter dublinensis]